MQKKNILILLLIFVLFLIVGCSDEVTKESYTIKFDSNSNDVFENIVIDEKSTINLPTPSKIGYVFAGWYPSEEYVLGTQVTNQTIIGKNITLHAKWNPIPLVITYDLAGGYFKDGSTSKTVSTVYNAGAELERAYLDNHLFMGWYMNDVEVTENTKFTSNSTVTAKYLSMETLQSSYKINLNYDGGDHYYYPWIYQVELFIESVFPNEVQDGSIRDLPYLYVRVVCDFVRDLFVFKQTPEYKRNNYSKDKIFVQAKDYLIGEGGFFSSSAYHDKWLWLFEYLGSVASEENKPYFEDLLAGKYTKKASIYEKEQMGIISELAAFINGTKNYTYKDTVYKTGDYTDESVIYGFEELLGITEYVTGEGTILLTPYKKDHIFLGWYDNPEFEGDPITEIKYNEYGEKTYYANWLKRG